MGMDTRVVALKEEYGISNGQPSLHALCLAALTVKEKERVVHIGAGAGYYTGIFCDVDFHLWNGLRL